MEPGAKFSVTLNIGEKVMYLFQDYEWPTPAAGESDQRDSLIFYYMVEPVATIFPVNGMPTETCRPSFNWSQLFPGAPPDAKYQFHLDRYYDFKSPILDVYYLDEARYTPDINLEPDVVYYWRVRWFDGSDWSRFSRTFCLKTPGNATPVDDDYDDILPEGFSLSQNYPNPFNPMTYIEYEIPYRGHVQLEVLNILGQKVKELVNTTKSAGHHQALWNGTDEGGRPVAAGTYFYMFKAGDYKVCRKMLFLK